MAELKIGNITLENNVILAPMAGVTDLPFRLLCRRMGAGLVCMEMISAKAIFYHNKNTEELLQIHPEERPVSLQLFGSDARILADMAKRIEERPFSILDFNMGCPVPKVVNNGEGSALMKDPKLAEEILSALVKAVDKPVTVKIRKGFDEAHCNAVEIAKIAEACGVAAIAVHGRTREQYYSGRADWDIIRQVKEAVGIPVIGNGDVDSPEAARAMLEQTGCDGVMIGRAAQGNPWIFREIVSSLESGENRRSSDRPGPPDKQKPQDESGLPDKPKPQDESKPPDKPKPPYEPKPPCESKPPDKPKPPYESKPLDKLRPSDKPKPPDRSEKKQIILEHAKLQVQYKGEYTAVREMRKHLAWYTVGMPHSARFRQTINSMETMEELLAGVETIFG